MARTNDELHTILDRIVARLIDQLPEVNEANCYYLLEPIGEHLPAPSPADFVYAVAPADHGSFDAGLFDGGGQNQATVDTVITVTIWSMRDLDKLGRDQRFLGDQRLGVMPRAKLVLKALAGHDLTDDAGNQILAQPLFPQAYHIARQERNLGSIQLGFSCRFDWDLS